MMSTLKATNLQNASSSTANIVLDSSANATINGNGVIEGNLQYDSGYGSAVTAYGCRAWGTWEHGSQSLTGGGNISSVTDYGTGQYGVSLTTAMPDAHYAVQLNLENTSAIQVYNVQTGSFTIWIYTGSSWVDANVHFTVHR